MKFGLYLVNKGVITAEQLVTALDRQQSKLAPIGQLAMEEAVLSARDVFKVLHCQSGMLHDHFGELAVDMGMMTQADRERLLMIQWERKRPLAEILVEQGVLSAGRVEEELAEFRRAMERRSTVVKRSIPVTTHLPTVPEMPDKTAADSYAMMI